MSFDAEEKKLSYCVTSGDSKGFDSNIVIDVY